MNIDQAHIYIEISERAARARFLDIRARHWSRQPNRHARLKAKQCALEAASHRQEIHRLLADVELVTMAG